MNGELAMGNQMIQEELAESFGTSRIPVREALYKLETEGLVEFSPYKGASVTYLTAEDANEIFHIRLLLEKEALRLAFPFISQGCCNEAEEILRLVDAAENRTEILEGNWRFHLHLYSQCFRPRLLKMIVNVQQNSGRYLRAYLQKLKEPRPSRDHAILLSLLRREDLDRSLQWLDSHLTEAKDTVMNALLRQPQQESEYTVPKSAKDKL